MTDIFRSVAFTGDLVITASGDKCILQSNGVPNHDFNDSTARFNSDLKKRERTLTVTRNPVFAAETQNLGDHHYYGITLGGVVFDLQSGWCYQLGAGETDLSTNTKNECLSATWIQKLWRIRVCLEWISGDWVCS